MGLNKSLQQKWALVQRATPVLGEEIRLVEKSLREDLLPNLFLREVEYMHDRKITRFLVKHEELAILDPTLMAQINWTALCVVTRPLVADLRGRVEFHPRDHSQLLADFRTEIQL